MRIRKCCKCSSGTWVARWVYKYKYREWWRQSSPGTHTNRAKSLCHVSLVNMPERFEWQCQSWSARPVVFNNLLHCIGACYAMHHVLHRCVGLWDHNHHNRAALAVITSVTIRSIIAKMLCNVMWITYFRLAWPELLLQSWRDLCRFDSVRFIQAGTLQGIFMEHIDESASVFAGNM